MAHAADEVNREGIVKNDVLAVSQQRRLALRFSTNRSTGQVQREDLLESVNEVLFSKSSLSVNRGSIMISGEWRKADWRVF